MARSIELLLTESVEGTGIVGDVVKVRTGFARNFLLPRGFATTPSEEKLASLQTKRADAQKALAELRKSREALVTKLEGFELEMIRSCNDLGILYGAVTQHEIAGALGKAGFAGIKDREVRIGGSIKRIDAYDVHVKFDTDLDATIKLHIKPDRVLDLKRAQADEAPAPDAAKAADGAATAAAGADAAAGAPGAPKREKDKSARPERGSGGGGGDRPERGDRDRGDRERPERKSMIKTFDAASLEVVKGWGTKKADAGAPSGGGESKPAADKGDKAAKGESKPKGEKAAKGEKGKK